MNVATHERNGVEKQFDGRVVNWLQTPETTGGQYCSVCTCIYDPGGRAYPAHSHQNGEETIFVISGNGKVKIGDEIFPMEPGSLYLFPQGVPHMVWNTGTSPMKLMCFYAPGQTAIEYTFHEDFNFPD